MREILTKEYRFDTSLMLRTSARVGYRKAWVAVLAGIGFLCVPFFTQDYTIRVSSLIYGPTFLALPGLIALLKVLRSRSAPIFQMTYSASFNDQEFAQLSEGEARHKIRYRELVRAESLPEGFAFYQTPTLFALVPRSAFQSPEDYATVEAHLKGLGLMK
jgi:hypothetical protein